MKNTGQVPLHDVTVTDNRIRVPIVCLDTTLAPGQSTTCKAIYTITEDDLEASHVVNTATATGHPPVGPPATDTGTDTVREIHEPGIQIEKTAFPTEYAVPGEVITYSYQVVNTGNKTLHGITVTDSRLGPVTCPNPTLAPGEPMTCHATHTITAADVNAGHIANAAIATGHPPTGPPVTDTDTDTVHAIQRPAIQIQKTASPAKFSGSGQAITFAYVVVNTGNKTLHGVTVTDSRIGRVSCPRATLAAGEAMTCHGTYITTAADVAVGAVTNVAIATGHPPTGPAVSDRDLAIVLVLPLVPVTG